MIKLEQGLVEKDGDAPDTGVIIEDERVLILVEVVK